MFGVCYYPEHWSEALWEKDAKQMQELGLRYVRIAEFAWSRIEPKEGTYEFEWLDKAINILVNAGLQVVLCTPTATPPKWLIDKHPEVLPVDPDTGRTRGFGSRRHYDFASEVYLRESLRISKMMTKRYANYLGVVGWQTDNELCCHDTTLSASKVARDAFRQWCEKRYGKIETLNEAWGNVFWSQEFLSFGTIELPVGTVTEPSPAHLLAWRRFSSDCVLHFHNEMVATIRTHAPDHFVTHNFIPMVDTGIDNHALAAPLDFTSYDNYPLGRTEQFFAHIATSDFARYMRTGHPDLSTYTFDQTRSLSPAGRGFWIMEQQPGPVNWAAHNPRPAKGMIRLWTLEAFAHGAECVSYFRWRQAAFAQEQMHAGLLRPDNSKAAAWPEVEQAIGEATLLKLDRVEQPKAEVAILTDCKSYWVSDIENQSMAYEFDRVQFDYYRALRAHGVNIDFCHPEDDLSAYKLIVAPGLPILSETFVEQCCTLEARIIFGPRSGAKTAEFNYPDTLPPGPLQRIAPLRVLSIETLRADCPQLLRWPQQSYKDYASVIWREELDAPGATVLAQYEDETPAVVAYDNITYMGTLTDQEFLTDFLGDACEQQGIKRSLQPTDVRVQQRGEFTFAFNYSERTSTLNLPENARIVLGSNPVAPRDVVVWK